MPFYHDLDPSTDDGERTFERPRLKDLDAPDRVREISHLYWRTHQMSDHLPMWAELQTNYTDAYLNRRLAEGRNGEED